MFFFFCLPPFNCSKMSIGLGPPGRIWRRVESLVLKKREIIPSIEDGMKQVQPYKKSRLWGEPRMQMNQSYSYNEGDINRRVKFVVGPINVILTVIELVAWRKMFTKERLVDHIQPYSVAALSCSDITKQSYPWLYKPLQMGDCICITRALWCICPNINVYFLLIF